MNSKWNLQEAEQYLQGIRPDMPDTFFHLAEVFRHEAFELCRKSKSEDYLVPYMMNDALEYYFLLKDVRITGDYQKDGGILSAQIVQETDRYILILRQKENNTVTLLFRTLEEHAYCYQYHRIGHFWRQGQEHWRQLVYMIGTAHDKYEFFGNHFCNEKERQLIRLMHFAPFRYWSPVSESLDAYYPEKAEGLQCMTELAEEAGDREFLKLLRWYRCLPSVFMRPLLVRKMLSPDRQKLYELICQKAEEASAEYPEREYTPEQMLKMETYRENVDKMLKIQGFGGTYPHYIQKSMNMRHKADETSCIMITAAEEHPFLADEMDWEDFQFRIRLMISEVPEKRRNIFRKRTSGHTEYEECGFERNAGFFRGRGYRAEIADADAWMQKESNHKE